MATAQPVINGTLDAIYGSPWVVQNTQTNFGNSNLGQVGFANGSEINAGYAYRDATHLYVFITGNLETNFNKLELFIDSQTGGQNVLRGDNPNVDFNGLNRMAGLTFDSGFSADHWFAITGGGAAPDLFANYAQLLTLGGGTGGFAGQTTYGSSGVLTGGSGLYGVTVNNSNVAGVGGGTGADSGLTGSPTTGMEFQIPLSLIGSPTGDIAISAFINGSSHDFLANQVLGGIGGGNNLGDPTFVNFNTIGGDQFFLVPVPEPTTWMLTGCVFAAATLRRIRSKK